MPLEKAAGRKSTRRRRLRLLAHRLRQPGRPLRPRYGYTSGTSGWRWGENLAYGRGKHSTPRAIVKAWLNSPPHRENMLTGSFNDIGIGMSERNGIAYWALELGCRGC